MLPRFFQTIAVYIAGTLKFFTVVWIADLVQQKMIFLMYDDRNHPSGFLLNLAAGFYGVVQCLPMITNRSVGGNSSGCRPKSQAGS